MTRAVASFRLGGLCVAVCLFASLALGQEKSGSLQGTVSDGTNAVLPGVSVTLANKSTQRVIETASGAYGDYTFRDVAPGHDHARH